MPPWSAIRQKRWRGALVLVLASACASPTPFGDGAGALRSRAAGAEDACAAGVCVVTQREADGVTLWAHNRRPFEVWIRFDGATLRNLVPAGALPRDAHLPPRSQRRLAALRAAEPRAPWLLALAPYKVTIGDPRARHDDGARYRLPFEAGGARGLSQGVDGGFSHGERQRFAFDFPMPEGTRVLAARAGTVAVVRDDQHAGGPDAELLGRANHVIVRHDDGTFATYAHLRPGGAAVREGERVAAGALLGLSGNTGFSLGPHLHFCVWKASARDGEPESLPIRFADGSEDGFVPVVGRRYRPARSVLD